MKLKARLDDADHDIEIQQQGNELIAVVDGRRHDIEFSEPERGVLLFKLGGQIFEASVTTRSSGSYTVNLKGEEFRVNVFDPRKLKAAKNGDHHMGGVAEIRTAMPGKVVRLLAAEGSSIEKGDGVIVVEAMKMQNEMRSPKSGTVKKIAVSEGDTVAAGDLLVTIE